MTRLFGWPANPENNAGAGRRIIDIGRGHEHGEKQTHAINDDVAFAAIHVPAVVTPAVLTPVMVSTD